jgi:hypothetical protein
LTDQKVRDVLAGIKIRWSTGALEAQMQIAKKE